MILRPPHVGKRREAESEKPTAHQYVMGKTRAGNAGKAKAAKFEDLRNTKKMETLEVRLSVFQVVLEQCVFISLSFHVILPLFKHSNR